MKNIFTFLFVCAVSLTAFAQFTEDFEGDISGTWTLDAAWVLGTSTYIASEYLCSVTICSKGLISILRHKLLFFEDSEIIFSFHISSC